MAKWVATQITTLIRLITLRFTIINHGVIIV